MTVFQSRRWDGDFLTARRLVDEGALGTVLRMESRFERFRPQVGGGWRELGDAAEGGGQLLDLGAHLVDQAVVLFGVPTHVYAEVGRRRPGAQADDDVFVALEHPDGVRSHHWMSAIAPLCGPRWPSAASPEGSPSTGSIRRRTSSGGAAARRSRVRGAARGAVRHRGGRTRAAHRARPVRRLLRGGARLGPRGRPAAGRPARQPHRHARPGGRAPQRPGPRGRALHLTWGTVLPLSGTIVRDIGQMPVCASTRPSATASASAWWSSSFCWA